jgi:hypothetical protein
MDVWLRAMELPDIAVKIPAKLLLSLERRLLQQSFVRPTGVWLQAVELPGIAHRVLVRLFLLSERLRRQMSHVAWMDV